MLQQVNKLKDYLLCAIALGTGPRTMCSILWREMKNIRVRLRLGSYNPNDVYSLQTVYGPLHFRDNFGDITNLVSLIYHNEYRMQKLTQQGVILDIGANIGLAAAWFASHNPGRTIYCFEPLAANAALISMNCPSAKVERVALGHQRGRIKLHVDRDNVMASSISCQWETQDVEFDVISLDEFSKAANLGQVALIKIDVEGMEVDVLKGCQETLKKTHQVVVETHSRHLHDEAIRHLRQAGLHIDSEQFTGKVGMVFALRLSMSHQIARKQT